MNNLQMWYNGEFLDADKAQVSLLDHGLHYGTGVFEGIRCYNTDNGPAVFRLSEHLARMAEGARTMDMNFDVHQMHAAILRRGCGPEIGCGKRHQQRSFCDEKTQC